MIKFEFKQTNQEATLHYRPPAPVADGSAGVNAWPDSNADGSSAATRRATSARTGGKAFGAGTTARHSNQPNQHIDCTTTSGYMEHKRVGTMVDKTVENQTCFRK
jgi:hypothetical protein